jgi:hypothetical protein
MRLFLFSFLIAVLFSVVSAQTRRQAVEEFAALERKIEAAKKEANRLEQSILQPDKEDLIAANKENARVFRILPREKYDQGFFKIRGGGAYYSFINESHDYNLIPQISLEQNYLSVGFYGASYGFLTDLGETNLAEINDKTKGVNFLTNYQPPDELPKARIEQIKARGFEWENISYKNRLPMVVGHSYLLRAISFDEADVLVAFKIHHQDTDGSLIIFWTLLENFKKPKLIRSLQASSTDKIDFALVGFSGNLTAKIEAALRKKGFNKIKVAEEKGMIVLRGQIPKGKMSDAVQTAQEVAKKPIINQLTEE